MDTRDQINNLLDALYEKTTEGKIFWNIEKLESSYITINKSIMIEYCTRIHDIFTITLLSQTFPERCTSVSINDKIYKISEDQFDRFTDIIKSNNSFDKQDKIPYDDLMNSIRSL